MSFKTEKIIVILLVSTLVSGVLAISIPRVHAETTAVKVMPQAMGFGPYPCVGTEFRVTMEIHDVLDLYGLDIKFGWNTGWIEYVNHTLHIPVETYPDGVLHEVPGHPVWIVMDYVDEWGIPGTPSGTMYWLGVAAEDPSPSFNGSGIVFDMFFRIINQPAKKDPNAVFDFQITESSVSNSTGWAISHDAFDATVTIHEPDADWHDVAVVDVTTNATVVDPGDAVNVTVVVENLGDYTETFDVTAYNLTGDPPGYYTTVIGTQTVSGLASKASKTLYFTWDTTPGMYGYYTIKAEASTVTGETAFPFDNILVDGAVYVRTHDVAVVDVTTNATLVSSGDAVEVTVVVENPGDLTETFDVTAYNGTAVIGTQTVTGLAPLASETLYFTWDTTGAYGSYIIKAEASAIPFEPYLDDNILVDGAVFVRGLGDANMDGIVDIFDIGTISAHWYPGPPIGPLGYSIEADINFDGSVDIFDIGITSANWGNTYPY